MNKMLSTMMENYKALMDDYKRDYEKECYESVEEFKKVVKNEYNKMLDVIHGMARYECISQEDYIILSEECLDYALDIMLV